MKKIILVSVLALFLGACQREVLTENGNIETNEAISKVIAWLDYQTSFVTN